MGEETMTLLSFLRNTFITTSADTTGFANHNNKCQNCSRVCSRSTHKYTNHDIEELWRADTFEYIRKIEAYKREIEFLQSVLNKVRIKNTYCFRCDHEHGTAICNECDDNASRYVPFDTAGN
jgi:hypothetical protein